MNRGEVWRAGIFTTKGGDGEAVWNTKGAKETRKPRKVGAKLAEEKHAIQPKSAPPASPLRAGAISRWYASVVGFIYRIGLTKTSA